MARSMGGRTTAGGSRSAHVWMGGRAAEAEAMEMGSRRSTGRLMGARDYRRRQPRDACLDAREGC